MRLIFLLARQKKLTHLLLNDIIDASQLQVHLYHRIPKLVNLFLLTAEIQWLEHLWNHENMFETEVVRAYEC